MVVALKPGRFYGTALPRPHIYEDVKYNDHRVDPPPPVNEALLRWASDAHWSMGGLSFKRTRLQGKIEGRISKLRDEKESSSPSAKKRLKTGASPAASPNVAAKTVDKGKGIELGSLRGVVDNLDADLKGKAVAGSPRGKAVQESHPRKRIVKRALLVNDNDLSEEEESDDGLEEFMRDTNRPLRRSSRIHRSPGEAGPSRRNPEESEEDEDEEGESIPKSIERPFPVPRIASKSPAKSPIVARKASKRVVLSQLEEDEESIPRSIERPKQQLRRSPRIGKSPSYKL